MTWLMGGRVAWVTREGPGRVALVGEKVAWFTREWRWRERKWPG